MFAERETQKLENTYLRKDASRGDLPVTPVAALLQTTLPILVKQCLRRITSFLLPLDKSARRN